MLMIKMKITKRQMKRKKVLETNSKDLEIDLLYIPTIYGKNLILAIQTFFRRRCDPHPPIGWGKDFEESFDPLIKDSCNTSLGRH